MYVADGEIAFQSEKRHIGCFTLEACWNQVVAQLYLSPEIPQYWRLRSLNFKNDQSVKHLKEEELISHILILHISMSTYERLYVGCFFLNLDVSMKVFAQRSFK